MERMTANSVKKRKGSPLTSKGAMEEAEMKALDTAKAMVDHLLINVLKLGVSKGKEKQLKDGVLKAIGYIEKYMSLYLACDCGPSPATVCRPETRDFAMDMSLTPEWWVPTRPALPHRTLMRRPTLVVL